jgi:hypothetical protein
VLPCSIHILLVVYARGGIKGIDSMRVEAMELIMGTGTPKPRTR